MVVCNHSSAITSGVTNAVGVVLLNTSASNLQEASTSADSSTDGGSSSSSGGSVESSSRTVQKAPVDPAKAAARIAEEAEVAKGQRTAVITGAVSIVFGVRHNNNIPILTVRWLLQQPHYPEESHLQGAAACKAGRCCAPCTSSCQMSHAPIWANSV